VEKQDRRPVSLAGLGLIGAGAVLGLTLAGPAAAAPPSSSGPSISASVDQPPKPAPKDES
jgi:hypothetical protein